jgi:hypothetical protein
MGLKLTEANVDELTRRHRERAPVPGRCVDIDWNSWHRDGDSCSDCGFGIDGFGDGRGFWSEPIAALVHACGDPDRIVPVPARRR